MSSTTFISTAVFFQGTWIRPLQLSSSTCLEENLSGISGISLFTCRVPELSPDWSCQSTEWNSNQWHQTRKITHCPHPLFPSTTGLVMEGALLHRRWLSNANRLNHKVLAAAA